MNVDCIYNYIYVYFCRNFSRVLKIFKEKRVELFEPDVELKFFGNKSDIYTSQYAPEKNKINPFNRLSGAIKAGKTAPLALR